MADGERLYVDMLDLNPPFIFWLSLPAALLGGEDSLTAFRVVVLLVVAFSTVVAWPLTRGMLAFRAGFAVMAAGITIGFFGEREHLLFALVMPYVATALARAEGRVARGLVPGVLAGLGFALKPHAALLMFALVLDAWRREKSLRVVRRGEHVAAAATLGAALLAILLLAPDYLQVVRAYGAAYAEFSRGALAQLLLQHWYAIGALTALLLAILLGRSVARPSRVTILSVAVAALLAAAVVQGKGFGYHYLPAMGFAVMLLLELVLAEPDGSRWRAPARQVLSGLALAVLLALPIRFTVLRAGGESGGNSDERAALSAALPDLRNGSRVAVLSIRLGDAYPLIVDRQWEHVLPVPHLWFVDAGPDTAVGELWRRVGAAITERRPEAIIVRAPHVGETGPGDEPVSYLRLVCQHLAAPAALDGYRLDTHAAGFDIYRPGAAGSPACLGH